MRQHLTIFINFFTLPFHSLPVSPEPKNTKAATQGKRPSSQPTSTHPIVKGIFLGSKDRSRLLFSKTHVNLCLFTSTLLVENSMQVKLNTIF